MKNYQRDIVEVSFPLPNGTFLRHPAIVISTQDITDVEGIFYAVILSTKESNEDFINVSL